jgi:hypothetical protein
VFPLSLRAELPEALFTWVVDASSTFCPAYLVGLIDLVLFERSFVKQ